MLLLRTSFVAFPTDKKRRNIDNVIINSLATHVRCILLMTQNDNSQH